MSVTTKRKRSFCRALLGSVQSRVGLADVGAGGPLKEPWNVFADQDLSIYGFEPTAAEGGGTLCVSNRSGTREFYVAADERASSLHKSNPAFVERFGQHSLLPERVIRVACTTLDEHFASHYAELDAIDINTEGHDLQVLQGATRLLTTGMLKLVKVEFELTEVWIDQGWFSDIDGLMRGHGFDLVGIDVQCSRPVIASHVFHRGEPLWGKALYAPGRAMWHARIAANRHELPQFEQQLAKAIVLYVAANVPGRAFDLLEAARASGSLRRLDAAVIKKGVERAFCWAKLEHGLAVLSNLAGGALRHMPGVML